jgi:hypothetical protein
MVTVNFRQTDGCGCRRHDRRCLSPTGLVIIKWERKWERVLLGCAAGRFVVLGPAIDDLRTRA